MPCAHPISCNPVNLSCQDGQHNAKRLRQTLVTLSEWVVQNTLHVAFCQITNQLRASQGFQITRPREQLLQETIEKKRNPVSNGKLKTILSQGGIIQPFSPAIHTPQPLTMPYTYVLKNQRYWVWPSRPTYHSQRNLAGGAGLHAARITFSLIFYSSDQVTGR